MHWAVNVQFRGTYWCFHPRTRTYGRLWRAYFYVSRDATPTEATFKLGRKVAVRMSEAGARIFEQENQ
jgi:hypothetical protein